MERTRQGEKGHDSTLNIQCSTLNDEERSGGGGVRAILSVASLCSQNDWSLTMMDYVANDRDLPSHD
jgi:hypothetical protein